MAYVSPGGGSYNRLDAIEGYLSGVGQDAVEGETLADDLSEMQVRENISTFRNQRALAKPAAQLATVAPTVTLSNTLPGTTPTAILACAAATGIIDPRFSYPSYRVEQAGAPGVATTDNVQVRGRRRPLNPTGAGRIVATWHCNHSLLAVPFKRTLNGNFRILVDGVEVFAYGSGISGVAQAGGASTITLASTTSVTNGTYNTFWVYIDGGTGAGQHRQIARGGYAGATHIATVTKAWDTPPDNTSTYIVTAYRGKYANAAGDGTGGTVSAGTTNYVVIDHGEIGSHEYEFIGNDMYFGGVCVPSATSGAISPIPKKTGMRIYWYEDSGGSTGAPLGSLAMPEVCCNLLGAECINLTLGGTGWLGRGTNSLKVGETVVPPINSWASVQTGTGGTISFTQNGITTAEISYAATAATAQTAFNNAFGSGSFYIGGVAGFLWIIGLEAFADITTDMTVNLVGGATGTLTRYYGELVAEAGYDGEGTANENILPALGVIVHGHNDDPAALAAEVTRVCNLAHSTFPTITWIVAGNWYVLTATAGVNNINAAILAGVQASNLPLINGQLPYIDMLSFSDGTPRITGTGSVITPAGTTPTLGSISSDVMNMGDAGGHPADHRTYGGWFTEEIGRLLFDPSS